MFKKITKNLCLVLALVLTVGSFAACSDFDEMTGGGLDESNDAVSSESTVLQFFEDIQDNEVVPFVLTEKAKVMLSENESLFLENKNEGLEEHTDTSLEYKVLTKNIDKHGDKLIYLPEAYVISIDETELDEETTCSELHLVDAEENSFYVLSLSAYDDIYEGDVVSAYALPIGETSFENVSGGTTLAIMLAGCYIEKIEG